MEQKRDPIKRPQLALYKEFWAQKHNVDKKNIRCGWVLLKKVGKPGSLCELVDVSIGDKVLKESREKVERMLTSLQGTRTMKNRTSCEQCEFYNTEHCK